MILQLVAAADEDQIGYVAAGPIEDFLGLCGEAVIERVEAQAVADPRFRHALGGAWQLRMSDEVYARVRQAGGDRW